MDEQELLHFLERDAPWIVTDSTEYVTETDEKGNNN